MSPPLHRTLHALARRARCSAIEWRVLVLALSLGTPVSAYALARSLGLDYSVVKRAVRGFVAIHLLERRPEGLVVQPDQTRWGRDARHVNL